jgi:tRNA dimethylallyltransferase
MTDLVENLEKFLEKAEKPLIVILGPTASGKTSLSLDLAAQFDGEIISTDSRQIYRHMDIATDAILEKDMKGISHHLLRIVEPDQVLTLAEYKALALEKIEEIYSRKKVPILAGGTGLYITSIIEGYSVPRVAPNEKLRQRLTEEAKKYGNEYLYNKLKELDPQAAEKIHPNNLRYVIRAIEINKETGGNKQDQKMHKSPFDVFMIGINWPREKLYQRINARVDQQRDSGLLEEVKALLAKDYARDLPSMTSLGVKEIIPYLENEMSLDDCLEILKQNTRRYAKRQMTWFRRYQNVYWINKD